MTRGKNGYGRFTFHKFARFAQWQTFYQKGNDIMSYEIDISNDNLKIILRQFQLNHKNPKQERVLYLMKLRQLSQLLLLSKSLFLI